MTSTRSACACGCEIRTGSRGACPDCGRPVTGARRRRSSRIRRQASGPARLLPAAAAAFAAVLAVATYLLVDAHGSPEAPALEASPPADDAAFALADRNLGWRMPLGPAWRSAGSSTDGSFRLLHEGRATTCGVKALPPATKIRSGELTWEDHLRQTRGLYAGQIPGFRFVDSKIAPDRSRCLMVYWGRMEGRATPVVQAWVDGPRDLFLITWVATETGFEDLRPAIEAAIGAFRADHDG